MLETATMKRAALVAAGLALSLTACAGPGGNEAGPGGNGSGEGVSSGAGAAQDYGDEGVYLDVSETLWSQRADVSEDAIFDLTNDVAAECMRERGWNYEPVRMIDTAADESWPREVDRRDVNWAKANGYGASAAQVRASRPETGNATAGDPKATGGLDSGYGASEREQAMADLMGAGGCEKQASVEVLGVSSSEYLAKTEEIHNQVYDWATSDEGYQRALGQWRACMSEAGYDVSVPFGAPYGLNAKLWAGDLSDEEFDTQQREMAVADAKCHSETQLVGAFNQAHRAAVERVAAELETEFMATQEMHDRAVAVANERANG